MITQWHCHTYPTYQVQTVHIQLVLRWHTGIFQNGRHENYTFAIQLDYNLALGIKCARCGFSNVFSHLGQYRA